MNLEQIIGILQSKIDKIEESKLPMVSFSICHQAEKNFINVNPTIWNLFSKMEKELIQNNSEDKKIVLKFKDIIGTQS